MAFASGSYAFFNAGTFDNLGAFVQAGPGSAAVQHAFNSSGTVSVQSGTLSLFRAAARTGRGFVAAGAHLGDCDASYILTAHFLRQRQGAGGVSLDKISPTAL